MADPPSTAFVDRFAPVAADYAAFRPCYPAALYTWLAACSPRPALAWDCATGTGQAARGLAACFERVVATDASAGQIAQAPSDPRIAYRVAAAEDSGLATATVDLVTVAQALHWFDRARFFAEVARVLRPDGILAVWTYGPLRVAGPTVDGLVQRYYQDIVGPYWPPARALVDSGYAGIALPYPELVPPPFAMTVAWTLEQLLGYLGTWSSTTAYREANGVDPRTLVGPALARAWGEPRNVREVRWPLTVRVCRKPGSATHASAA